MESLTRKQFLGAALAPLAASAQAQQQPGLYFADLRAAMQVEWPKNQAIHIAAHGHSVPSGYFRTPMVQTFESYPHLFHRHLATRFPHAVINVVVTAIGGEHSLAGAARFERDVLAFRPKLVLIDYGLNDRGPGLAKAREAWLSMIRKSEAAGAKLILLTPTGDSRVNIMDDSISLSQHAVQIREIAKENNLPLVDSYEIYRSHIRGGGKVEDLLSQVNHPNRRGHDLVAAALLDQLLQR